MINLVMVIILIVITGIFVATEFALVKMRSSKIDQFVMEGKKGALAAKKVTSNLDEYLSATQLGITVTAMALGWLGEPTVRQMLHPLFEKLPFSDSVVRLLSLIIAFSLMTYVNVVIGELTPKTIAIQKTEKVALLFSPWLIVFHKITYPFIRILNGSARIIVRAFGLKPASDHDVVHTEEELRLILSDSYEQGEINHAEYMYVNNIFEFDNRLAKEIMVPRTEIIGFHEEISLENVMKTVHRERYTRYPIFREDKDEIIGMVNVKDLCLHCLKEKRQPFDNILSYMRPVIEALETIPIHNLLLEMQKKRIQLAVLYDEYGGTAGIVTIEDILEEIVGEIRDEYDEDERAPIQEVGKNHLIVDGKVLINEINDRLDLSVDETAVDTIGGWILTKNYHIREGEFIEAHGYQFKVLSKESHYIEQIEIRKADG